MNYLTSVIIVMVLLLIIDAAVSVSENRQTFLHITITILSEKATREHGSG